MKRIKSIICVVLALCTLIPMFTFGSNAIVMSFVDVKFNSWYYDSIFWCYHNGTMVGNYPYFRPNGNMTRAEFVVTLGELFEYDVSYKATYTPKHDITKYKYMDYFTDVKRGSWYHDQVMWAYSNGYVSGVGNKKFNPNGYITRQEIATILQKTCNDYDINHCSYFYRNKIYSFKDYNQISSWAFSGMQWAVGSDFIKGTSPNTLSPKKNVTRAEAATMICTYGHCPMFDYKEYRGD